MSTSRNVDRKPRATLAASLLAGAGVAIAALGLVIAAGPARADYTQHRVVTIDASTAQPLSTGLIGTQLGEEVIFYAEGSLRVGALPERFDEGWFGPAGQTNWTGTGQPIVDGMPYGALIGGFNGVIGSYQFLGRMGSFSVQPADVGQELRLALNLSDADLASLEGSVTITLIVVPPGSADVSQVTISRTTTLPIGTGLFAATGDRFVVLPYGVMRDPALPNSAYTEGWFGPEGLLGVVSGTQPHTGAPYGALFGQIGLSNEYWIGDGGAWTTQPSDVGSELMLTLNTDAVSQAGLIGKFVVNVARIPATDVAGVDGSQDLATGPVAAWPNPTRGETTIRYRAAGAAPVLLRIHDAQGRWVRTLVDGVQPAGAQAVQWDGRDDDGRRLPAGAYFYQLRDGSTSGSKSGRIVILD